MLVLAAASGAAHARVLQVSGSTGYLSEWELSGVVTQTPTSGGNEFFGPLIIKHVGLCSVNGPLEKHGEIRLRLSTSGALSRINATISLDGGQCRFSGEFSGLASGHMDCPDAKGVPISLSLR